MQLLSCAPELMVGILPLLCEHSSTSLLTDSSLVAESWQAAASHAPDQLGGAHADFCTEAASVVHVHGAIALGHSLERSSV